VRSLVLVAAGLLAVSGAARTPREAAEPGAAPAPGRPADLLPFKAVERTLPNKLKVIVVPTGFPNLVSLQIPVQTGSRNEVEPGKSGFAHFFEHMMFRGTEAWPPEKYEAVIARAGARQNAYTSDDHTNYHVTFAKEDLETMLRIEADRFQNLTYEEQAFKTEARAVLGEYNKNSANPLNKLLEVQHDRAFTTHTYKHTTMGFLKDIEDMPNQFAYSREFFRRWYRPEYTTVIVAGDVVPEQVLPLVEKYWGSWKPGAFKVQIPAEPEPKAAVYAHVPWQEPTPPWVSVAFHGPAFSETGKDFSAMSVLLDLTFGSTSELYKRLVEQEQKVDQLFVYAPPNVDPDLATVFARVKQAEDAVYVRDQLLQAFAAARDEALPAQRLADAKANARYGLLRTLDTTEQIAATLASYVHYRRSYATLNNLYRVYESLAPADLQAAARRYFTDNRLVVTTLSNDALPEAMAKLPPLAASRAADADAGELKLIQLKSLLPQLDVKLLFTVGSAHDPAGKEGLAALSASMIAGAGSRLQRIDEIKKALFPMAASFDVQVDKEMTTFTAVVHRDNWKEMLDVSLPMLLEPGFREDDFQRLKDVHRNALLVDLRTNNEEELAKERLQESLFAGGPYGHTVLGTAAGIEAITLDDVKEFVRKAYTRDALSVGLIGDAPPELLPRLRRELAALPAGPALPAPSPAARRPRGIEVELVQKETRATAISFGHPLEVTRSHPDFAALWLARAWLGEHRSSLSHLYQRIRELRGMNYGDYAYVEAFPRGMYQFFPDPNIARRAQLFEVWIRPVQPQHAQMALRIAIHELRRLIAEGLTQEEFDKTREYLSKNVFLMTATQDQRLGYALDSAWYGMGEFTSTMRERLAKLSRDQVNAAIRKHWSGTDLAVVIVTRDAQALRQALLEDEPSTIRYDAEKPPELLAEDRRIGALKLQIRPDAARIIPVEEVFAK
jgi:zinc protease